ncbi:MAG TPA: site-specific integrase [Firmicutes bacterium]|nr:site-specific integrase [Bacillota bacterium]
MAKEDCPHGLSNTITGCCVRHSNIEMNVSGTEGVQKLLKSITGHEDEALIAMALYTGMRLGEILGLRWQDVDLEARKIHVQQTLQRLPNQGFIFRAPKTEKGRRQIALSQSAIDILHKVKKQQAEARLRLGSRYQDDGLVFCHEDGRPLDPTVVTHRFRRLADSLGLEGFRFHDLRHTHATLLLAQGTHPKIVQERLGHESISITLDTYSHVLPGLQEAAAEKLDIALSGTLGHRLGTDGTS